MYANPGRNISNSNTGVSYSTVSFSTKKLSWSCRRAKSKETRALHMKGRGCSSKFLNETTKRDHYGSSPGVFNPKRDFIQNLLNIFACGRERKPKFVGVL